MKCIACITLMFFTTTAIAQNVGIGTSTPQSKLHIVSADSSLLMMDQTNTLAANAKNILYFKTGVYYTGAIASIGSSTNEARLGLFSYAVNAPQNLRERLSILDDGKIGIGTITPNFLLDVAGDVNVTGRLLTNGASGATGQILRSSGASTPVWTNGPGQYGFNTGGNGTQNVPNNNIDQELDFLDPTSGGSDFENGEVFSGTTNEFTAPVTGIYLIAASAGVSSTTAGRVRIGIKNAVSSGFYAVNAIWCTPGTILTAGCFAITQVTAGTKLIPVLQNITGNPVTVYNGVDTYFSAVLIK